MMFYAARARCSSVDDDAITVVVPRRRRRQPTWADDLFAQLRRDVAGLPRADGAGPPAVAPYRRDPNVFELPPHPNDPPPPWAPARTQTRRAGAILVAWFLLGVAAPVAIALSLDPSMRADAFSRAHRAVTSAYAAASAKLASTSR